MDIPLLIDTAEKLKQGLLAKATDGEYLDKDYRQDVEILSSDNRVSKMLPAFIRANRSTSDFRRSMQADFPSYAGRRTHISDQLKPIFEYLENVKSGTDQFSTSIDALELGSSVGNGGYGTVYLYHHKLLDMDFAIKLFEPVFVSNEENLEGEKRFFREAKVLFQLNHENIVRVYDIGRLNGQPFIRMEFVDGETIQNFVAAKGTISFERSVKPILALLNGLSYAHKLGVIHRDLKPSNFMFTKDGKFKIIDFGISAFLESECYSKLTKTGEAIAGGLFTDPMLMSNPKLRDVRSDIYSVGAIWYFLLVGRAPAGGDARKNLLLSGNATELQCDIIFRCLTSNPEDRYQSCKEILSILSPPDKENKTLSSAGLTNKITDVTREAIFDYLVDRNHEETNAYIYSQNPSFQEPERVFYYSGRRDDVTFLSGLYDLESIPSADSRLKTFADEIQRHTIANDDYPYGWVFRDERLGLINGNDETLLKFICEMFHPRIRSEKSDWESVKNDLNELLKQDGYELYESEKISGRSVFSYKYCI